MKIQRPLFAISIALLLATAAFANVTTDYDRSVDFSRYKTYSWEKVETSDPLRGDRMKQAVDSQLAAKGWTRVESGGQVAIIAIEITRNQQSLNTLYNGLGRGRWGSGFGNATTTEDTYQVGTVLVNLFDGNTKKLIWRGSSTATLSDKSDKNIKTLDKDVQKMFEHFPPEVKR